MNMMEKNRMTVLLISEGKGFKHDINHKGKASYILIK
jgi:hypothetical protein